MNYSVSVAVGNVRGNPVMDQPKVREDCDTLMRLAQVVLAVEIKIPRYNRAFRRAAAARGKRAYFERSANQIAVPATAPERWAKLRSERIILTKGAAWIPQPKREADVLFDDEHMIAYVVAHMTNGGWNRRRKPGKKARQRRWLRQERKIRALVARLRAQGYTVIIGGDLNTGPLRTTVDFHPEQQVVLRSGLMWLLVVPAEGVRVTDVKERVITDVNTDHPFIRATLTLAA